MSGPIVYVDRSEVREGKLEELRLGVKELVEFVDAREPQLVSYGFYFNPEGTRMTVVAVHPDSASLELHMEIGREAFRRLGAFIDLSSIDVYGRPSDRARELLRQKAEMLGGRGRVTVHDQQAGFARFGDP